jgi:hypothetical protein
MPLVSVDAVQLSCTDGAEVGVAVTFVGTVGGSVSTVQDAVAGLLSVVPLLEVANTENVWLPFASAEYVRGVVHDCEAPPSRRHVNVAGVIVEWNVKVAVVLLVGVAGALSITVSGFGAAAAGDASAPRSATVVRPPTTVNNRWRSPTLMAPFPG